MHRWTSARPKTRMALVVVVGCCVMVTATARVARAAEANAETTPGGLPAPPPPPRRPPAAAYVVLGLAAAGAVAGSILGVEALDQKRAFDDGDRTTGRVENIEKKAVMADMAFGAALALGITSAVLFLTGGSEADGGGTASAKPGSLLGLAPLASPSGVGATALVRF